MQLQSVLVTLIAFAVTGSYALPAENSANACYIQCDSKPTCSGGKVTKNSDGCWSCCIAKDFSTATP